MGTTKSVTDGGTVAYTYLYIVSIVLLVVGFISGYAVGCVKCANKSPYTVVDSSPVPSPTASTSSLGNGPALSPLHIRGPTTTYYSTLHVCMYVYVVLVHVCMYVLSL